MLKKILIVIVVLVAGVLVLAATKPDAFHVERTTSINAPPEKVMPLISDFHSWQAWSPWARLDPTMKQTYSGAASGQGAVYEWAGNGKVGSGRMQIMAVSPTQTTIALHFMKPMDSVNTATFTLQPDAASTNVVWAMDGPMPFASKIMSVFFSMDKLIGKDFEHGLANLKAAAEK